MLRGINVSGHKIIKMERLRASFVALGFGGVKTCLQSGNVVFTAAKTSVAGLAENITGKIQEDFGFSVPVLIRTAAELDEVLQSNPFAGPHDAASLYVTFLSHPAPRSAAASLKTLATAREQFSIKDREIYLFCPEGYGGTKISNPAIEKKLSLTATTRNCRTVKTLLEMAIKTTVE